MAESKKQKANRLYYVEGLPTWKIAEILDVTEAKVCDWIGLLY